MPREGIRFHACGAGCKQGCHEVGAEERPAGYERQVERPGMKPQGHRQARVLFGLDLRMRHRMADGVQRAKPVEGAARVYELRDAATADEQVGVETAYGLADGQPAPPGPHQLVYGRDHAASDSEAAK